MAFGVFFDLRLRHDFWLNMGAALHETQTPAERARIVRAAPSFMAITPTAETARIMAGHGMLFKSRPDGARIGIELQPGTNQPRRPLAAGRVLRFGLRLNDPVFASYTAGLEPRFYAFSTASANNRGGELHLSQPLLPFQTTRRYQAGEIRAQYIGARCLLFQARRDTGPAGAPIAADWQRIYGDTHDPTATYLQGDTVISNDALFQALVNAPGANLGNAADWTPLGVLANQYATLQDQIALRSPVFAVDVAALAATSLRVEVMRQGAATPVFEAGFSDPQGLTSLPVDLRSLPNGRYQMVVRDQALQPIATLAQDFYLSAEGLSAGWFGVIEVSPEPGAFALLDGGGQLTSPRFDLRFLNASARQRYRFPAPQPVGTGAEVAPDPGDASILISPAPLPITAQGTGVLLRADDPATPAVQERILLPTPTANALQKQGGEWFSDHHMTNFPPLS